MINFPFQGPPQPSSPVVAFLKEPVRKPHYTRNFSVCRKGCRGKFSFVQFLRTPPMFLRLRPVIILHLDVHFHMQVHPDWYMCPPEDQ